MKFGPFVRDDPPSRKDVFFGLEILFLKNRGSGKWL